MKISGLIFIFLMFFSNSNAQWQKQNVDTKAGFRGLAVVSEKVIWASGTGGTVLRSIDGGKTWSVNKVADAEKLDFRDIEAFDADTAYILSIGTGESSRIYKTTDGGKTWKLQFKNTNPKAFFDAFAFWDKTHGIAMSDPVDGKYLLLETTDGETWKRLDTSKMPNAKDGEAAFAASKQNIVCKTVVIGNAQSIFQIRRHIRNGMKKLLTDQHIPGIMRDDNAVQSVQFKTGIRDRKRCGFSHQWTRILIGRHIAAFSDSRDRFELRRYFRALTFIPDTVFIVKNVVVKIAVRHHDPWQNASCSFDNRHFIFWLGVRELLH